MTTKVAIYRDRVAFRQDELPTFNPDYQFPRDNGHLLFTGVGPRLSRRLFAETKPTRNGFGTMLSRRD